MRTGLRPFNISSPKQAIAITHRLVAIDPESIASIQCIAPAMGWVAEGSKGVD